MLLLKFTRVSNTHHRLEYERADGSGEAMELESKSFLMHDFLHYAVEMEAHLSSGFWGLMAKGYSLERLNDGGTTIEERERALDVERVTGAMTNVAKGTARAEEVMESLRNMYSAYGTPVPMWLTLEMLKAAAARYHQVWGHWNSLRFGETLELQFQI